MSNKVVKGTFLLSVMVLVTKIIGFFFWFPFQNIAGDAVVGIYRRSFPFYNILLTIASAGVPITISKFVAERLAQENYLGARRVMHTGSIILSITGLISSAFLYFGSEFIARTILDDQELVTVESLKVLALSILVVPVMAVMRGYFQGHQDMMPTGLSQLVEQVIRVGALIALTSFMVGANAGFTDAEVRAGEATYTLGEISAGATSGAFFGAIGGLLVVLWYNRRDKKELRKKLQSANPHGIPSRKEVREGYWSLSKKIIAYAIPISLASLVLPLLEVVDSATIPRILQNMGVPTDQVDTLFGIYYRGNPLINVISVFSSSLTLVLIPAISAHIAKKEYGEVKNRIYQSWLMTLAISLPCSIALFLLAEPINVAMYGDNKGSWIMAILSLSAIFSTLAVTSSGILQGMGYNNIPVRHLLVGAGVKVIGNFVLIPHLGLNGSAIAMVACYATVCILNVSMVIRKTKLPFPWIQIIWKPIISTIAFGIFLYTSYSVLASLLIDEVEPSRILYFVTVAIAGVIALLIYLITLVITKTLREEDLKTIPMGTRIVLLFKRIGILRGA